MQNDMKLNDAGSEYYYINNSHDKIFRKALDNKNDAVKIINRILKNEYRILEEDIEKYNSSYISERLRNSEADVVYKIKNKDVFFLIEHQTIIDYSMPYRILKYQIEIMDSVLINKKYKNKQYEYPIIIPIVLYTGSRKWDAKNDLIQVQLKWEKYKGQEFSRYNILDINNIDNEELLKEESLISKMMLIEKSRTNRELEKNLNGIINIITKKENVYNEEQKKFIMTVINNVLQKKIGKEAVERLIKNLKLEGGDNMLAVYDMIDRENARIRREGIREGVKKYKEKMIKDLRKKNYTDEEIKNIMSLDEEDLEC